MKRLLPLLLIAWLLAFLLPKVAFASFSTRSIRWPSCFAEPEAVLDSVAPRATGSIDGAAGIGGLIEILTIQGNLTTRSLPIYDGIGNIIGLIDAQTGARLATYSYGPFGELLAESGPRADQCPFRYQTKLYDCETGDYYFGKRYYDPKTQTWLNRDPIREEGGANLYAYCNDDPVGNYDPIGLLTDDQRDLLRQANAGALAIINEFGDEGEVFDTPESLLNGPLKSQWGSNLGWMPFTPKWDLRRQYGGESDEDVALLESTRRNGVRASVLLAHAGKLSKYRVTALQLRGMGVLADATVNLAVALAPYESIANVATTSLLGVGEQLTLGAGVREFASQAEQNTAAAATPLNARLVQAELRQSALAQLSKPQITVLGSLRDTAPYIGREGFNVLNVAGDAFDAIDATAPEAFDRLNAEWLNTALGRGDDIWLVTDPATLTDLLTERYGPMGPEKSRFLNLELPMLENFGITVPASPMTLPMSVP